MNIQEILLHLEGVREHGEKYEARCPAHEDRRQSLSVATGRNGGVVLHCHAGCAVQEIANRIGITLRDLMPANGNQRAAARIVATYDYRDATGRVVYQVVRFEPKDFRQRRPAPGGEWAWNLTGVRRVLYRLPELLAADPGAPVFVVEGEKDADRLRALGLIATTNPGGAGKWRPEYGEALKGRRVVILPDNDDPGRKHGEAVAAALRGVAASVKVLELAGLLDKADVSEWLDAGHDAAELRALVVADPTHDPMPPKPGPGATPVSARHPRTDAGNAELFAHLYGARVRFDHRRGRWLLWSGHRWVPDADAEVVRLAKAAARHRYGAAPEVDDLAERKVEAKWAVTSEGRQRLDAALALAKAERPIADAGDGWDADPLLLGCENCVVDLRTGTLRPGRPDDRITMSTGIAFDPKAKAPRWERFLDEVFAGDASLAAWVQLAVGYSATADTREHVFFLKHGPGGNGKGVFDRAVSGALGDYAANTPFSTLEVGARPAIPNDLAALVGRRFVTASESTEATRLNEARVKALSGGDPVTARFLQAEWFTFTPALKLWCSVNFRPRVSDLSSGFWRRVRLIPFNVEFTGAALDRTLDAKLADEAPGVLAWIARGAVAWLERGLDPTPECVLAATAEYRQDSDPLADFLAARCTTGPDHVAQGGELYRAYVAWAEAEGLKERDTLGARTFGERLGQRFHKAHGRTGTVYQGVGLADCDGSTVTPHLFPNTKDSHVNKVELGSPPVTRHAGTDARFDR